MTDADRILFSGSYFQADLRLCAWLQLDGIGSCQEQVPISAVQFNLGNRQRDQKRIEYCEYELLHVIDLPVQVVVHILLVDLS